MIKIILFTLLPLALLIAGPTSFGQANVSARDAFVGLCEARDGSRALAMTFEGLRNVDWADHRGTCGELYDFLEPKSVLDLPGQTFQRTEVSDISPLKHLPNLRELILTNQRVADISPLEGLPLRRLILTGTDVPLSPIRTMSQLEVLAIDNADRNLAHLHNSQLKSLSILHFARLNVDDLKPIATLESLSLGRRMAVSPSCWVPPLNGLQAIRSLEIFSCNFNAEHLNELPLTTLIADATISAAGVRITNVNALRALVELQHLALLNRVYLTSTSSIK